MAKLNFELLPLTKETETMSIYKTIRAFFDRTPLIGGGGPQPELAGVRYVSADDLPDVDRLIEAELVTPWRTDQDGVQWYRTRAEDADLASVDAYDPDQDEDLDDIGNWSPHQCHIVSDDFDPFVDDEFDPFDDEEDFDEDFDDEDSDYD